MLNSDLLLNLPAGKRPWEKETEVLPDSRLRSLQPETFRLFNLIIIIIIKNN